MNHQSLEDEEGKDPDGHAHDSRRAASKYKSPCTSTSAMNGNSWVIFYGGRAHLILRGDKHAQTTELIKSIPDFFRDPDKVERLRHVIKYELYYDVSHMEESPFFEGAPWLLRRDFMSDEAWQEFVNMRENSHWEEYKNLREYLDLSPTLNQFDESEFWDHLISSAVPSPVRNAKWIPLNDCIVQCVTIVDLDQSLYMILTRRHTSADRQLRHLYIEDDHTGSQFACCAKWPLDNLPSPKEVMELFPQVPRRAIVLRRSRSEYWNL